MSLTSRHEQPVTWKYCEGGAEPGVIRAFFTVRGLLPWCTVLENINMTEHSINNPAGRTDTVVGFPHNNCFCLLSYNNQGPLRIMRMVAKTRPQQGCSCHLHPHKDIQLIKYKLDFETLNPAPPLTVRMLVSAWSWNYFASPDWVIFVWWCDAESTCSSSSRDTPGQAGEETL